MTALTPTPVLLQTWMGDSDRKIIKRQAAFSGSAWSILYKLFRMLLVILSTTSRGNWQKIGDINLRSLDGCGPCLMIMLET